MSKTRFEKKFLCSSTQTTQGNFLVISQFSTPADMSRGCAKLPKKQIPYCEILLSRLLCNFFRKSDLNFQKIVKIQEKLQHLPNIKNQSTTTYIAIYAFPISFFLNISTKNSSNFSQFLKKKKILDSGDGHRDCDRHDEF